MSQLIQVPGASQDAFNALSDQVAARLGGEIVTVSGTTNSSGNINATITKSYSGDVFVLSNVSESSTKPYSVTVSSRTSGTIRLRVGNMSDNSAVASTAVEFTVLVVGFIS